MYNHQMNILEFNTHHNLNDEIYGAMRNSDPDKLVIKALDIFKKTNVLPALVKVVKTEAKSTHLRNIGNTAYKENQYQKALIYYNKALLYAPKNSRAMKVAYSNRSALFLKMKEYTACINDIETCFTMGCPKDLEKKLLSRYKEVKGYAMMEKLNKNTRSILYPCKYFLLDDTQSMEIQCAISAIGAIRKPDFVKVVAKEDIKVGTLLALETAFVSNSDINNDSVSCFYCHKMNLNLKPCDNCCLALFCSDTDCMKNCLEEFHAIECQIIDVLNSLKYNSDAKLALKAVLKIRKMCLSWDEFIKETNDMGTKRMNRSSFNEIFSADCKFSLLNNKDEKHFLHGPLHNMAFASASILYYLDKVMSYLPQNKDQRKKAMEALGRTLLFLSLFSTSTQMILPVSVNQLERTDLLKYANYGWFSFIGKLKNDCNSNCLTIGLNKQVALVSVQPIKKGTELTIPYVGNWIDNLTLSERKRNYKILSLYGIVCNCVICTGEYKNIVQQLSEAQKRKFRKLNIQEMAEAFHPVNIPDFYAKLSQVLAYLANVQFSDEYVKVYTLFRRCILYMQDNLCDNIILSQ